jgi:HAD superfamily hydrolase (TIGR01509 family)
VSRPTRPRGFATVLFDVDGTLVDSREFVFAAFEHTLGAFGLAVPARERLARLVGPPLEAIYADLAGAERAAGMAGEHRRFQSRHLELVVPFEGADTLAVLRERGLRVAAVTSRSRITSVASLARAGLDGLLDAIVSAEDTVALKPDPRHLQAALDALGADRRGVAMVGDSPADIEGGRSIGAHTVAALYGFHGSAILESKPDRAIEDIRALPEALDL